MALARSARRDPRRESRREHGIIDLCTQLDLEVLADRDYQRSGGPARPGDLADRLRSRSESPHPPGNNHCEPVEPHHRLDHDRTRLRLGGARAFAQLTYGRTLGRTRQINPTAALATPYTSDRSATVQAGKRFNHPCKTCRQGLGSPYT